MEKLEKLRILAGSLLIISGITHNLQLFFHGFEAHQIQAAIYGMAYAILGILLLIFREKRLLSVIGGILPILGGILGLYRLITYFILTMAEINFFIILHVIIDIIVVPICWNDYFKRKSN